MELNQLKCLEAVARHKSMTKAGEELFISQPAVSNIIHRIESEIGVSLFFRKGKQLELNEYGDIWFDASQKIIAALDDATQKTNLIKNANHHTVRIMITSSSLYNKLTDELLRVSDNISFLVGNIRVSEAINMLENNIVDFCICGYRIEDGPSNIESCVLESSKYCIAVNKNNPFSNRKSIEFRELDSIPIVAMDQSRLPRREMDRLYKEYNINPIIYDEISYMDQLNDNVFMKNGTAVFLGPINPLKKNLNPDIFNFIDLDGPTYERIMYWNGPADKQPQFIKQVRNFIIQFFKDRKSWY